MWQTRYSKAKTVAKQKITPNLGKQHENKSIKLKNQLGKTKNYLTKAELTMSRGGNIT